MSVSMERCQSWNLIGDLPGQNSNFDVARVEKDFVLKLRLIGVYGSPQIRRVRLPRIQVGGHVSFAALQDVAISYSFPDAPSISKDYDIMFTYYDIDNDCVTIASTEELIDAIDQFSNSLSPITCLRINANVQQKIRPFCNAAHPTNDKLENQSCSKIESKSIKMKQRSPNIVNSFASLLINVVDNLQTPTTDSSASSKKEEIGTSQKNKEASIQTSSTKSQYSKDVAKQGKKPDPDNQNKAQRLFIHGRHTCDGCLYSPIIGPRYHATNMPDYDLCSHCWKNYTGEIKFEVAELESDCRLQERWHQKRAELNVRGSSCRRKMPKQPYPNQSCLPKKGAIRSSVNEIASHNLIEQPESIKFESESKNDENSGEMKKIKSTKKSDQNIEIDCKGETLGNVIKTREESKASVLDESSDASESERSIVAEVIKTGVSLFIQDQPNNTVESPGKSAEKNEIHELSGMTNNVEDMRDHPTQDEISEQTDSMGTLAERVDSSNLNAFVGKNLTLSHCSEDEWNVIVSEKVNSKETIARAAKIIGSALFEGERNCNSP